MNTSIELLGYRIAAPAAVAIAVMLLAPRLLADDVSRQARATLASGGVRSRAGREAVERMDHGLRDARHFGNPGTTADLTAAAIFVALLDGAWRA